MDLTTIKNRLDKISNTQITPDEVAELFMLTLLVLEKMKQTLDEDVSTVGESVKNNEAKIIEIGNQIKEELRTAIGTIDRVSKNDFETSKSELQSKIDEVNKTLTKSITTLEKGGKDKLSTLEKKLNIAVGSLKEEVLKISLLPGEKGDTGDVGPKGDKGDDGSPDTPEQVRDKLASLQGDERLDKKAIKGLDEAINEAKSVRVIGGQSGMFLYVGGVKKGLIKTLDLVGSSGIAIAYSKVNGLDTITFTVSGSGITVETPPETPNAVTTVFTVTAEPKWVVADGITYYANAGYTYSSLQVTMTIPPSSTIRAII